MSSVSNENSNYGADGRGSDYYDSEAANDVTSDTSVKNILKESSLESPPSSNVAINISATDSTSPTILKIFVGGLTWNSNVESITAYFQKFGTIKEVSLLTDRKTNHPRGFAFVSFINSSDVDAVFKQEHEIDGKKVEIKIAVPRDKVIPTGTSPVAVVSKKIFVGGLDADLDLNEFRSHYAQFGAISEAVIMIDKLSGRSRRFGFVTFESDDAVDRACGVEHSFRGKVVEVKRAEPKEFVDNFEDYRSGGQRFANGDRRQYNQYRQHMQHYQQQQYQQQQYLQQQTRPSKRNSGAGRAIRSGTSAAHSSESAAGASGNSTNDFSSQDSNAGNLDSDDKSINLGNEERKEGSDQGTGAHEPKSVAVANNHQNHNEVNPSVNRSGYRHGAQQRFPVYDATQPPYGGLWTPNPSWDVAAAYHMPYGAYAYGPAYIPDGVQIADSRMVNVNVGPTGGGQHSMGHHASYPHNSHQKYQHQQLHHQHHQQLILQQQQHHVMQFPPQPWVHDMTHQQYWGKGHRRQRRPHSNHHQAPFNPYNASNWTQPSNLSSNDNTEIDQTYLNETSSPIGGVDSNSAHLPHGEVPDSKISTSESSKERGSAGNSTPNIG